MRILCFHLALAPYRLDFFNILSELAELRLILLQDNLANQKFNMKSLTDKLKINPVFYKGKQILGRQVRLCVAQRIDDYNPDVVIGYESSLLTIQLLLWRLFHKKKVAIWTCMDDSPSIILKRRGFRRWIRDFVIRQADKIIVPSEDSKLAYCKVMNCIGGAKYAVVPIIHDVYEIRKNESTVYAMGNLWRRTHIEKDIKKVLLFVGRLTQIKNLEWLVERMSEIDRDICLVMVGSGDLESQLHKKVDYYGLSKRVIFAGHKEGDDLYSFMAMSDGLVLCSISEPYGAVIPEALQWGTPCVVSDNCGAATLINDRVNGCVFRQNDPKDFLRAINELPMRSNKSILNIELRTAVCGLMEGVGYEN